MTKRGGKRSRSRNRRSQQGGQSAWQFQLNNLGDLKTQIQNTFSTTGLSGYTQSNDIVPNRSVPSANMKFNDAAKGAASMKGGVRRGGKRGGNWGAVLGTAAVPLTLLGMQQAYGRRHTRRHPGHFRNKSRRRR